MPKYRGWTALASDDDDGKDGDAEEGRKKPEERLNSIEIEATRKFVQISVGGVDGVAPDARRIRSEERPVVLHYFHVDQEMRRLAGRRRPMTAVPKPTGSPGKKGRTKDSGGRPTDPSRRTDVCQRCGGEGEYEWSAGFYKPCPHCNVIPGDEDLT